MVDVPGVHPNLTPYALYITPRSMYRNVFLVLDNNKRHVSERTSM